MSDSLKWMQAAQIEDAQMTETETPIELETLKNSRKPKKSSSSAGTLIAVLLGGISAVAVFFLLRESESGQNSQSRSADVSEVKTPLMPASEDAANSPSLETSAVKETTDFSTIEEKPLSAPIESDRIAAESKKIAAIEQDAPPLVAPREEERVALVVSSSETDESTEEKQEPEQKENPEEKQDKREEIKLSKRRWTTLVLLQDNLKGEFPLPDNFPIWNYEKGYDFVGARVDGHRLGNFRTDGEFIIRDGYLRREFGNTALLHLPAAENFELEGIMQTEGPGGWLILLGWDVEKKSGYVIYNTQSRVSWSIWFLVEIIDGKAVPDSEKKIVDRHANGEGALRVLMDKKKVSMQAVGAYLFRDEELPNYKEGHVAIGTFSPQYGPKDIGIKSLRMKLR